MRHELIFNGKALSEFGIYVDGSELFTVPSKVVESVSIAGRNGDLLLPSNRWENVPVSIPCVIRKNFRGNFSALVAFLNSVEGYARLESTELPDVYRMAHFASAIEPQMGQFNRFGQFVLNFDAKPQKFLKSGDIGTDFSGTSTLINPTAFTALPLIEVSGLGTVSINNDGVTIAGTYGEPITIDSETEDAYSGSTNMNTFITLTSGKFPVLSSGENIIRVQSSGSISVTIHPRWWTL